MQVIIHKTGLLRLELSLHSVGMGLGDPVQLILEEQADVAAYVSLPSRLPFGLGKPRVVRLGDLNSQASALLSPALAKATPLRVRIVEIQAAHLNMDGVDQVSISVWGNSAEILKSVPRTRIFSSNRIHDGQSALSRRARIDKVEASHP
jgi:hypothetical protein